MADLVSVEEFEAFLGDATVAEKAIRATLLDQVEATFERECGREGAPFKGAQTGIIEALAGTGGPTIHLSYPIALLTSVKLGFDATSPDETLNVSDKKVLIYEVGKRYLTRVDGGIFGTFGAPAYVHVTYNAAAELPKDAILAILRRAAAIYRQRGSEEASRESTAGAAVDFALQLPDQDDTIWQSAVAAHWRAPI